LAFTALINFDPSISRDPCLNKIGSALQSSNLYAAQHFREELQGRGGQLQSHVLVIDAHLNSGNSDSLVIHTGSKRIDLFA
jgi:hypothetical protein